MARWERMPADLRADRAGIGFPIGQTVEEVKFLIKYAKLKPKNTISVEIGTRNGGSALILAMNTFDPVVTIDILVDPRTSEHGYAAIPPLRQHWARYPGGKRIEPVFGVVSWTVDWSKETRPVGLLFVDGGHELDEITKDWNHFFPHVVEGGYILVHDYGVFPGVTEFIDSLPFTFDDRGGSIIAYKK